MWCGTGGVVNADLSSLSVWHKDWWKQNKSSDGDWGIKNRFVYFWTEMHLISEGISAREWGRISKGEVKDRRGGGNGEWEWGN